MCHKWKIVWYILFLFIYLFFNYTQGTSQGRKEEEEEEEERYRYTKERQREKTYNYHSVQIHFIAVAISSFIIIIIIYNVSGNISLSTTTRVRPLKVKCQGYKVNILLHVCLSILIYIAKNKRLWKGQHSWPFWWVLLITVMIAECRQFSSSSFSENSLNSLCVLTYCSRITWYGGRLTCRCRS